MSNDFFPNEDPQQPARDNTLSLWDEIRRLADELELEIHLAGMRARDRWRELEPQLNRLEQTIKRSGRRMGDTLASDLGTLRSLLAELRDEIGRRN